MLSVKVSLVELCLSYLLSVELFDHRLKSLFCLPTVPTKTTQAECKILLRKLISMNTHAKKTKNIHAQRERIFFDHVELWTSPAEGAVRLVHSRFQVSLSHSRTGEARMQLQTPQFLLNLCVPRISHQALLLLSL